MLVEAQPQTTVSDTDPLSGSARGGRGPAPRMWPLTVSGAGEDGPMKASVQDLLAGPRGRRVCLEAARMLSTRVAELVFLG